MRANITFVIIALMLVGFVAGIAIRHRAAHQSPPEVTAAQPSAEPASSVVASVASSGPAPAPSSAPSTPKLKLGRPLRVVAMGWENVAAGVMANDGVEAGPGSAFTKKGLEVSLSAEVDVEKLENALARGGKDPKGADVAILPLQRFSASYEHLKALDPVIFFVVSWSDGREVVLAKGTSFESTTPDVKLSATAGSTAAFLALFALDLAGSPPDKVTLVNDDKAPFVAMTRKEARPGADPTRDNLLLSTSEASRLVPIVAVAQRALVAEHGDSLIVWAGTWLDGHAKVAADASEASRKIAAAKGGPEPLAVLGALGQVAPASLAENAAVAGLSGRGAVTLEALFQRSWDIWRKAKVLTIPPEKVPLDPAIIAALVRAGGALSIPDLPGEPKDQPKTGGEPLLTHRLAKGDLDMNALVEQIGFIAGVFRRSPIRITVHPRGGALDKKQTAAAIEQTVQRFGVTPGRLSEGKARAATGSPATIEIMPIP